MVKKCAFCGRLFEGDERDWNDHQACPRCVSAAKRNDYPGTDDNREKPKKFLESDGFFSKEEYLSEDRGTEFFESSDYHN
jgi:hypothetical protein